MKRISFLLPAICFAGVLSAQTKPVVPEQKSSDIVASLLKQTPPAVEAPAPKAPDPEVVERARLKAVPAFALEATNVPLRSVIRLLADQCGMNCGVALASVDEDRPVTWTSFANPFDTLQDLSDNFNFGMSFNHNTWHFFSINNQEPLARIYQLKNNTMETFDSDSGMDSGNGTSNQNGQNNNQANGTNTVSNNSTNGGTSSGLGSGLGSTPRTTIKRDPKALKEAIQKYLDMDTTGSYATFIQQGSVGEFFPIPKPDYASAQNTPTKGTGSARHGTVEFLSDSNQLYITATRQQHEYIEGFLEALDQPQKLVAIETKFVEMSRTVSNTFGMDWSGVTSGTVGLSGLNTSLNLADLSKTSFPNSAILSASDMKLGYAALATDNKASSVQYPRVVTVNNRQVSLQSVVQRPALQSTTATTGGGLSGSQTVQSVVTLNVGTVVDIYPKILSEDNVLLNIVISVSNVTGSVVLQGNPYPVVSRKLFNYQVIVKSGYTLAAGGLDETVDTTSITKTPGLGDIPFFGFLFSSRAPSRDKTTLMMFITPTVLKGYAGGLPDKPQYAVPSQKQTHHEFTGAKTETVDDVRAALTDFPERIEILRATAREGRVTDRDITMVDLLANELALMDLKVKEDGNRMKQSDLGMIKATIAGFQKQVKVLRSEVKKSASFASHP